MRLRPEFLTKGFYMRQIIGSVEEFKKELQSATLFIQRVIQQTGREAMGHWARPFLIHKLYGRRKRRYNVADHNECKMAFRSARASRRRAARNRRGITALTLIMAALFPFKFTSLGTAGLASQWRKNPELFYDDNSNRRGFRNSMRIEFEKGRLIRILDARKPVK